MTTIVRRLPKNKSPSKDATQEGVVQCRYAISPSGKTSKGPIMHGVVYAVDMHRVVDGYKYQVTTKKERLMLLEEFCRKGGKMLRPRTTARLLAKHRAGKKIRIRRSK